MKKLLLLATFGLGSCGFTMSMDTVSEQPENRRRQREESSESDSERQVQLRHSEAYLIQIRLNTNLLGSVKDGDVIRCRSLLDEGANPLARTPAGITALHLAAFYGHFEIVKILLDCDRFGAISITRQVLSQLNASGNTALHIAFDQMLNYRVKDPRRKDFLFIAAYIVRQAHLVKAPVYLIRNIRGEEFDQNRDCLRDEVTHRAKSKRWKP